MFPNWIWWVLLANIAGFVLENIYRKGSFPTFWSALPWVVVPALIIQWSFFNGYRKGGATSLLIAVGTSTIIAVLLRMGNSYILGEPVNKFCWIGVALMIAGRLCFNIK